MERRITKYFFARGESEKELEDKVNNLIAAGYEPLGGPIFTPDIGQRVLLQAMVSVSVPRS